MKKKWGYGVMFLAVGSFIWYQYFYNKYREELEFNEISCMELSDDYLIAINKQKFSDRSKLTLYKLIAESNRSGVEFQKDTVLMGENYPIKSVQQLFNNYVDSIDFKKFEVSALVKSDTNLNGDTILYYPKYLPRFGINDSDTLITREYYNYGSEEILLDTSQVKSTDIAFIQVPKTVYSKFIGVKKKYLFNINEGYTIKPCQDISGILTSNISSESTNLSYVLSSETIHKEDIERLLKQIDISYVKEYCIIDVFDEDDCTHGTNVYEFAKAYLETYNQNHFIPYIKRIPINIKDNYEQILERVKVYYENSVNPNERIKYEALYRYYKRKSVKERIIN